MKLKVALICLMAVASLTACSSDSKTARDTPSPFKSPTPSPFKPSTPAPTPYDPVDDRSEEGIRLNIQQADKSITYEHLKKNAERYDGEPWVFTGRIFQIQVFQIQESGGQTTALVSLDSWGSKTMYVRANFTTDFVEKDQVYVVGYLAGAYSYTSVAGWNLTVPAIDARAILKPSEAARFRGGQSTK